MNRIGALIPDMNMIMFTDESVKDGRTHNRLYGWAHMGEACCQCVHFVRGVHYSILPVLSLDGIIAYDIVQGPVSSEWFLQFLHDYVVCLIFLVTIDLIFYCF